MNNLDLMRKRLESQGGIKQEDRMIRGKYLTFLKTLKYSYQGCDVMIVQPRESCPPADGLDLDMQTYQQYRALINPDKVKQDYDDKILSIDYQAGYRPGDVFQWINTGTHWIIYTRELTEDAYFRGEIRRCKHRIKFRDEEGNIFFTWAAIRGPLETQIESIQKNQIRLDKPNLSLNILLPCNPLTIKMFNRYSEFMFGGRCWQVQAPDSVSMTESKEDSFTGVLEINAEEYFKDKDTDTDDLKDGLVIKEEEVSEILGETFIMPKIAEKYTAPELGGKWCVQQCAPVKIVSTKGKEIELMWDKMTSGQFTLSWSKGDKVVERVIVVESLLRGVDK